ncbi:Alpha/Beta hydrolase protein, partial [Blyttiomyces helicus]
YVGIDNGRKTILVAFRATINTLRDWLGDLDVLFVGAEFLPHNATVSNGFLAAYRTVQSGVQGAVKQAVAENPGYTISFTGHSLGGASATLAAADGMVYLKGQVDPSSFYIMTNGSPRVGNKDFAELVTSAVADIWRSANFDDAVPKVVRPPIELGYIHVGRSTVGLTEGAVPPNPTFCGPDGTVSSECPWGFSADLHLQHDNYYDLVIH